MRVDVVGRSVPGFPRREIRKFVNRCYKALIELGVTPDDRHTDVTVSLLGDSVMAELNHRWRGREGSTDILTFPSDEVSPDGALRPLGDLAISLPRARRQAADEKHSLATEIRYLLLHGMIHALGYDHETDDGEMSSLELEARRLVEL
ncbi:MAG: rRNA maturation RNase YbeY [Acidobacteria bacterium]|nr:rRNA maturation RNase YbeY [Acidobacteriota bacterium]